jgi:hypothetical protein
MVISVVIPPLSPDNHLYKLGRKPIEKLQGEIIILGTVQVTLVPLPLPHPIPYHIFYLKAKQGISHGSRYCLKG